MLKATAVADDRRIGLPRRVSANSSPVTLRNPLSRNEVWSISGRANGTPPAIKDYNAGPMLA
jgi:hypothetical protein